MSKKSEYAVDMFMDGYNCSQSVFLAFSDDMGIDKKQAARLVNGLGGGIGKTSNACGVLTAMALVLGEKFGKEDPSTPEKQVKTYEIVKGAMEDFKAEYGSHTCPGLLGYDIAIKEEFEKAVEQNAFKTTCPKYVEKAVLLIEDILANN